MRFHFPGVPHTKTNHDYISCAYTQKILKLCKILSDQGHTVFHYGCEGSNPTVTENVDVVRADFQHQFYPPDFENRQFVANQGDEYHQVFFRRCAEEIRARKEPGDFLLCAWGWGHQPVAAMAGDDLFTVEPGIGYPNFFAPYRVFESYTWMNHVYALKQMEDGAWYDCVIPNCFDPGDFEYRGEKEDWFLYLGRIIHRKGLDVAVQVTREIGSRLVIAGQGSLQNPDEYMDISDPHVDFVGFADREKRRDLMARARAVFVPTYYLEPFGGVSIEAAFSGTPVITTDWSVFGENVLHGQTGYRCRTFDHFCWAAENVDRLSPADCRQWAMENFTLERVGAMYSEYFSMLQDLRGGGWYQRHPGRRNLDWLNRKYPGRPREESVGRNGSKPRIGIWTDPGWAFGRLFGDLKRMLPDFHFILFDWGVDYEPEDYADLDLIYAPIHGSAKELARKYPRLPREKIVCGVHGAAELFFFDPEDNRRIEVSATGVENFELSPTIIEALKQYPLIGTVSRELYSGLSEDCGLENLAVTRAGVDTELFFPRFEPETALRVVYPLPREMIGRSTHGYDAKRGHLVLAAEERLKESHPHIKFIYPERVLKLNEMPDFYRRGDIYVCTSHSEGGPLTFLEAGACGLVPICTPVGVIPELVEHEVNGYLLSETEPEQLVGELNAWILHLDANRHLLHWMRKTIADQVRAEWDWSVRKQEWKDFFDRALQAAHRAGVPSIS